MNIISKRILSVVLAIMVVMTSCFAVPTVNAKAASSENQGKRAPAPRKRK